MLISGSQIAQGESPRTDPTAIEPLAEVRERLRKLVKRSSMAEYKLALAVRDLAKNWERYADEADCSIGEWLRKNVHVGRTLNWYIHVAAAHDRLGHASSELEWRAGCWVTNRSTVDGELAENLTILHRLYRRSGSTPLSLPQAKRALSHLLERTGKRPEQRERLKVTNKRLRERIERLEAQIRSLGAEPIE
jgi:hypothetical protein